MMKNITRILIVMTFILVFSQGTANALKLKTDFPEHIDGNTWDETGKDLRMKITDLRPNIEYKADGLRNPFEQPSVLSESEGTGSSGEKAMPKLVVHGIIWGSSLPQAIINNKEVKVGDTVEGADVVDISKEGVIILFAGIEHKLSTAPAMGQQDKVKN